MTTTKAPALTTVRTTPRMTTTTVSITTAARTWPETSSQLTADTNDLKNEKEEFISMELLIGEDNGTKLDKTSQYLFLAQVW